MGCTKECGRTRTKRKKGVEGLRGWFSRVRLLLPPLLPAVNRDLEKGGLPWNLKVLPCEVTRVLHVFS